jgi:hypothetical protein
MRAVAARVLSTCSVIAGLCTFVAAQDGKEDAVKSQQDQIIAHIKKLGGTVELDGKRPGKPVIKVNFFARPVTDADLEALAPLTDLEWLGLSNSKVTGAGLKHFRLFRK